MAHGAKGVVIAKDSPNFIGNHIALYAFMRTLAKVAAGEYTIEEVDAITGPPLGRPKSATFRTMDIAGLDVLGHVVAGEPHADRLAARDGQVITRRRRAITCVSQ